jgi:predicted DNA-binding transcriptional regulator YafY
MAALADNLPHPLADCQQVLHSNVASKQIDEAFLSISAANNMYKKLDFLYMSCATCTKQRQIYT